ncbi:uncharacterized protein LOC111111486 isoform X1 [Crassostrea virginica]
MEKSLQSSGNSDYRIDVNGKVRLLHANLLKKYMVRDDSNCAQRNELFSCVVLKTEESDGNEQLLNILPTTRTKDFCRSESLETRYTYNPWASKLHLLLSPVPL